MKQWKEIKKETIFIRNTLLQNNDTVKYVPFKAESRKKIISNFLRVVKIYLKKFAINYQKKTVFLPLITSSYDLFVICMC